MLYNVDLLAQYGSATYQSAVWDSATYGSSNPVSPTSLVMQQVRTCSASFAPALCLAPWILPPILSPAAQDCNLVLLSGANALIYSSSTGGEGTACALTVSGLGGGLIRVSSSNSTVLYVQPSAFQILLEGQSPTFSGSENQVYDLATNAVFQVASLPPGGQGYTVARTLLPTINSVLAFGFQAATYLCATPPMRASAQSSML